MKTIIVNPKMSIQKLLSQEQNTKDLLLKLEKGIYREKIIISNNDLTIQGLNPEETIITFDDYNYKIHEDGQIFNTFRTPTINVIGQNVRFENLTIKNAAGKGEKLGQAIALSVYGNLFKAYNCHFHSYQDTIFCGPLPIDLTIRYQNFLSDSMLNTNPINCYFQDCLVTGAVDYIFGSAYALFDNCHIISIDKGYIVAPSTYQEQPYGFVFRNCLVENQAITDQVYLARPWREHGACTFLNCNFKGNFHPDRYCDWDKNNYRFKEYPYVESKLSSGLSNSEKEQLEDGGGDF